MPTLRTAGGSRPSEIQQRRDGGSSLHGSTEEEGTSGSPSPVMRGRKSPTMRGRFGTSSASHHRQGTAGSPSTLHGGMQSAHRNRSVREPRRGQRSQKGLKGASKSRETDRVEVPSVLINPHHEEKEEDEEEEDYSTGSEVAEEQMESEDFRIDQLEKRRRMDPNAPGIHAKNSRFMVRDHLHKYEEIPLSLTEGRRLPRMSSFSKNAPFRRQTSKLNADPAKELEYHGEIKLMHGLRRAYVSLRPSISIRGVLKTEFEVHPVESVAVPLELAQRIVFLDGPKLLELLILALNMEEEDGRRSLTLDVELLEKMAAGVPVQRRRRRCFELPCKFLTPEGHDVDVTILMPHMDIVDLPTADGMDSTEHGSEEGEPDFELLKNKMTVFLEARELDVFVQDGFKHWKEQSKSIIDQKLLHYDAHYLQKEEENYFFSGKRAYFKVPAACFNHLQNLRSQEVFSVRLPRIVLYNLEGDLIAEEEFIHPDVLEYLVEEKARRPEIVYEIARACDVYLGDEAYSMAAAFAIVKFNFETFKTLPRETFLKGRTCLLKIYEDNVVGGPDQKLFLRFASGAVHKTKVVHPKFESGKESTGGKLTRQRVRIEDSKILQISQTSLTSLELFL